jgi:hypothetical protein
MSIVDAASKRKLHKKKIGNPLGFILRAYFLINPSIWGDFSSNEQYLVLYPSLS